MTTLSTVGLRDTLLHHSDHTLKYCVLDGFTDNHTYVHIYKGLTEGVRLSPLLWGLYITDLLHSIQRDHPHLTLPHPYLMTLIVILLYDDDFCLIRVTHTMTPSSM